MNPPISSRRVVLQMGMSVDGYSAHPPAEGEHDDLIAWKLASLGQVGTHIMGRVTYDEMAAHWPFATGGYATAMNDIPKVVFSTTLVEVEWAHSRIAHGPLADEIGRLKRETGKDIMAHGGPSFVQALSREGLVDEYRLVLRPVVLGDGLPLFTRLSAPMRLRLVDAVTFPDGNAVHVYRPAAMS